jgi:hypothetical protein
VKVYLSVACTDHEGFDVMCAFKTRRAAERHAKRCEQHARSKWDPSVAKIKEPRFFMKRDSYDFIVVEYYA